MSSVHVRVCDLCGKGYPEIGPGWVVLARGFNLFHGASNQFEICPNHTLEIDGEARDDLRLKRVTE